MTRAFRYRHLDIFGRALNRALLWFRVVGKRREKVKTALGKPLLTLSVYGALIAIFVISSFTENLFLKFSGLAVFTLASLTLSSVCATTGLILESRVGFLMALSGFFLMLTVIVRLFT